MPTTRTADRPATSPLTPPKTAPDVEASLPASTRRSIPPGAEVDHPGEVPHGSGDGPGSASGSRAATDGQSDTTVDDRAALPGDHKPGLNQPVQGSLPPPGGGVIPPPPSSATKPRHPLRSGHHRIQHPTDVGGEQSAPTAVAGDHIAGGDTNTPEVFGHHRQVYERPADPQTSPVPTLVATHPTQKRPGPRRRRVASEHLVAETQTSASGSCRAAAARSAEPTTDPDPTPARRATISNHSPRLLHETEGVAPRDRNRNHARHLCRR